MAGKRVGILIFPQVEVLDFCGPFEVFSVTRPDEAARRETPSPFEVRLVAETAEPVTAPFFQAQLKTTGTPAATQSSTSFIEVKRATVASSPSVAAQAVLNGQLP